MSEVHLSSPSKLAPLVSVLVPAFNHQDFIVSCLDSIVESSYAPLEILIIDDGSVDDTYARAYSWMEINSHRVMRVDVRRQENQGITRTLNALVESAQGEYVALLASDDELETEGIQLRVSALQQHPEWLAVFGDCSIIDSAGHQQSPSALKSESHAHFAALMNPRRIARELILKWYLPGPATLARRSAYDSSAGVGPYDEKLRVEDRDFYLRLLSINGLGFIPDRVARYRLHGNNSSGVLNRSVVWRDAVLSEWRNAPSFGVINRSLLALIAIRGWTILRSADHIDRGNRLRGQTLGVVGKMLSIARKSAYLLHVLSSPR